MASMYDIYLTVAAYSIIIVGSFLLYNFLSKGYLLTFIRVKASRGKKVMVRVLSTTGRYFAIGTIKDGLLQFLPRGCGKHEKASASVTRSDVHEEMGIKVIDYDEENGKIISMIGEGHQGRNIDQFDAILVKALNKPNLVDKTRENIMLVAAILSLVAQAVVIYMLFNMSNIIAKIGSVGVVQ